MKAKKRFFSLLLALCLVVGLLPTSALAAETSHDISTSTLTITQDGSYTVTGTTTTNRIVVYENVTATVTLNGVNITGVEANSITGDPAQSPIDLSAGATLTLVLSDNSTNTLTGGAGGSYDGAPGIHVPDDATLIIQGGGSLSATGGTSNTGYGGTGIGGKSASASYPLADGESCGTVIILSTGNINYAAGKPSMYGSDGKDIGGGTGNSGVKGDDGQGIRPSSAGS